MSSEWSEVLLGDVASTRNGAGIKQDFFASAGVPLARVSNFSAGTIDLADCVFVDPEHAKRWQTHRIGFGDVIVATVGSWPPNWSSVVGKVVRAPERAVGALQNQNTCCVIAREGVTDQRYLYYLLSTEDFVHFASNAAAGSANQARIGISSLLKFPISLPALREQREIANFLGALDDRITLLRETNATLEAIAQALFKSWFVDFDPVRAKLEGRAPEGMIDATAALFPDNFEESELGLVPTGWRVATLADLSSLNPESWTAKNHPDTVAYIDLANAKDNEIASVTDFAFGDAPSRARRVLRDGDTIVGTVRPGNRSFAFIHESASNLTASTGFAVLRPLASANTEFVYLAATQDTSIEHLEHVADGGAYPAVRPDVVSGLQCIVPDRHALEAFHAIAAPLLAKVAENQMQAQTLATLRDTLLPRLISGQVRLPVEDSFNASGTLPHPD